LNVQFVFECHLNVVVVVVVVMMMMMMMVSVSCVALATSVRSTDLHCAFPNNRCLPIH